MTEATAKKTAKKVAAKVEEKVEEVVAEVTDKNVFETFFDHQRTAATEFGKMLEALIPDAIKDHGQSAVKEMLEGYRKLFNGAIDNVVDTIEKVRSNANVENVTENVKKAAEPLTNTFESVVENVKKAVKIEIKDDEEDKKAE
ncbi:MAG TPA: hypothetical protein PLZ51_09045 [Aggregatilineales bacterium]|nr:hypothetical protein [Aggregatilineales bacterium]